MRMNHWTCSPAAVVLAIALGVVGLSACSARQPGQGLISDFKAAKVNRHELQVRLAEVEREFAGHIKSISYEIYKAANDSTTRRRALLVAIRSNEMLIDAATHSDPVISLADMWALITQMRELFESDRGSAYFPEHNQELVAGLDELEQRIIAIANDLAGPAIVEDSRKAIEQWAKDNSLEGRLYRPSIASIHAASLNKRHRGLFSVAETLDESVSRVAMRIEILNNQLPQQITWHAAMLIEDLLDDLDIEAVIDQARRVMTLAEQAPQIIDEQRDAVLRDIDRQRVDTLDEVDRHRELITAELDRQRTETLASIETTVDGTLTRILHERDETLARFDTTLASTLDRIHDESATTVAQVESIAVALVADVDARIQSTVDRAFQRLLLLLGVALAGAAGIAAWLRRRPAAR